MNRHEIARTGPYHEAEREAQRVAAVASVAPDGGVWCSLLVGPPGFLVVDEDGRNVGIDVPRASAATADALMANLAARAGGQLGLLTIDLATRRRARETSCPLP